MRYCFVTKKLCENAVTEKTAKNFSCNLSCRVNSTRLKDLAKCPLDGGKNEAQKRDVLR